MQIKNTKLIWAVVLGAGALVVFLLLRVGQNKTTNPSSTAPTASTAPNQTPNTARSNSANASLIDIGERIAFAQVAGSKIAYFGPDNLFKIYDLSTKQTTNLSDKPSLNRPTDLIWSPNLDFVIAVFVSDTQPTKLELIDFKHKKTTALVGKLAGWTLDDQVVTLETNNATDIYLGKPGEKIAKVKTLPLLAQSLVSRVDQSKIALTSESTDSGALSNLTIYDLKSDSIATVDSNTIDMIGWSQNGTLAYWKQIDGAIKLASYSGNNAHTTDVSTQGLALWLGNNLVLSSIASNTEENDQLIWLDANYQPTQYTLPNVGVPLKLTALIPLGGSGLLGISDGLAYEIKLAAASRSANQ